MDSNEQGSSVFREDGDEATIPFTDLPECPLESPLAAEWNCYRSQVGRFLTDGKEGKWVLFKGDELIGIYETHEVALAEGYRRYPGQSFLVHQICAHEPILHVRGYNLPCPVSITQLAKPA